MKYSNFFLIIILCLSLAACGGKTEETESSAAEITETAEREDIYPEMIEAIDPAGENSTVFGIMHAYVLEVQSDENGSPVFTLRDDRDPEEAWTVDTATVKDVSKGIEKGSRVAVFFRGDIVKDPDSMEVAAVWPDGKYELKAVDGVTVNVTINEFEVRDGSSTGYVKLTFVKNNCLADKDAMENDRGDSVRVIYVDDGTNVKYPLRIYKLAKEDPEK